MKKVCKMLFFLFVSVVSANLFLNTEVYASNKTVLQQYYNSVLVPQYGKFKKTQTGTMRNFEDAWMSTSGIMSKCIADYDGDGKKEMMVCIAETQSGQKP